MDALHNPAEKELENLAKMLNLSDEALTLLLKVAQKEYLARLQRELAESQPVFFSSLSDTPDTNKPTHENNT